MVPGNPNNRVLVEQARALFTEHAIRVLPGLAQAIGERLSDLASQPDAAREMQERRDAWQAFQQHSAAWLRGTARAWSKASAIPATATRSRSTENRKFELLGDDVMEDRILASRLALRLLDFASWELNDLRLRVQNLEAAAELHKQDILRPEILAQHLVDQWIHAPLPRQTWLLVQDLIHKHLGEQLLGVYHVTNEFLVQRGVMAQIDLRPLVKRTPAPTEPNEVSQKTVEPDLEKTVSGANEAAGDPVAGAGSGHASRAGGASAHGREMGGRATDRGNAGAATAASPSHHLVHDETRMQTATTPLARARIRAHGVLGHLRRLLANQAGFDDTQPGQASAPLAQAMDHVQQALASAAEPHLLTDAGEQIHGQPHLDQAIVALRERTRTLKQAASTASEKASIEIVALMFQSILAEDRIPAVVRVWIARLQMPVLRVAIAEPEFFGSLQHPARRLIDRMGSCVLGFDATVSGGTMESEIRRIVQVIEQYPETGSRVFQLVYDEFDRFLSKFLTQQGSAARVVSVTQQVEQKETMVIQYTIEMRKLLNDMPVRDEIREFLFKVWAEVLALATMKNGPQHKQTLQLKQAAANLVWAVSAKPERSDRAHVMADLPKLLQLLRLGMSMLGQETAEQDRQLKIINATLADAFMSKTDAISMERIDAMASRLMNLEDYLSDADVGELPLDIDSLVTMIGIDAAKMQVIADGGSHPTQAMLAWVKELQPGNWFNLDHNGQMSHVQFAWCSARKQLHLFAAADGRNFLIQARRLAAYLQAGLLVPMEEEALTVRATRDALAKLDANPERLLG